jgi:O-acetyl-ADP-ribose deacetylase (regulator of RNase III)
VAKENGLHSIAFPLISAGIYGYPQDLAWLTALQACKDFINADNDYDMDIIFAVIDDGIMSLGQKTMAELDIADKM